MESYSEGKEEGHETALMDYMSDENHHRFEFFAVESLSNNQKVEGGFPMSDISEKSPTQKEIERRAYEIYLDRGSENGRDVDDWLAAEKELLEQYSSSPQKTRTAAAGQGRSAPVTEADSKHVSPAHHNRIEPSR